MKKIVAFCLLFFLAVSARADHITGGEMTYTYLGMVNGQYQYRVQLKLYKRCNTGNLFADPNIISVFNQTNNARVMDISVPLDHIENIGLPPDPCITNPPEVCFEVGYYITTVLLPSSVDGYVLASEANYRIRGINNIANVQVGATYSCEIPGTSRESSGPQNKSVRFTGSDLVIVCAGNSFSYSFSATDDDGDILRYSFCSAYNSQNSGANGSPASPPPFPHLVYGAPAYSEISPMGDQVDIDPNTGLITGIAPPQGIYVVTVCVEEIRGGVVIATQRKDIQIQVADCSVASAQLQPAYYVCKNIQSVVIVNQSTSPLIIEWSWKVFDPAGNQIYSTDTEDLVYAFPAPGTYKVKLRVNPNGPCSSEDSALVYVYPGLIPDFDATGFCISRPPVHFTDRSVTTAGSTITSWKWDFGDLTTVQDLSNLQNPTYTYPSTGPKTVRLVIRNSNGCVDTVRKVITIIDKPSAGLTFKDTLICRNDALQLNAAGTGTFSWSPNINIVNANTATPIVSPTTTIWYYVDIDNNGCINRDSVKVNVVNNVTLQLMSDTTICAGDTIQLRIISDGLRYTWSPSAQVIGSSMVKNPFVVTNATTPYQVTAVIGGCSQTATIRVITAPYPVVDAGQNQVICYNETAQLLGHTDGNSWQWSPGNSLNNTTILNPMASPLQTTIYTLTAFDSRTGCPKPSRDQVTITVSPPLNVSAGRDTAVVVGQSLQLLATGATNYLWSPPDYLLSTTIADPTAIFLAPHSGITYKVVGSNPGGCMDSAYITVKVFAGNPEVYVPSAFTPNNDGKNDRLRPIGAGIRTILSFYIYNRWGQVVYSGNDGQGWDGRIGGQLQSTNTYVWVLKAIDYTGKPFTRKGIVTLIR